MNRAKALKVTKSFHWERWLHRPWDSSLYASFACGGGMKEAVQRTGIPISCRVMLYQDEYWYSSPEIFEEMREQAASWLKTHRVEEMTNRCDGYYEKQKKLLLSLPLSKSDVLQKFKEVYDTLTTIMAFIWQTHALEQHLEPLLQSKTAGSIDNPDDFIRKATFPRKLTAYSLMEKAMREGKEPQWIAQQYGWLKTRDIILEPFTSEEIKEQIKNLGPEHQVPPVVIPPALKKIIEDMQELVYFRTHRTDVFYELLFLSRPILRKVAEHYHLSYEEVRHHPAPSLLSGKLERFSAPFTMVCYEGTAIFQKEPLVKEKLKHDVSLVKGTVAHPGKMTGTARVLLSPEEMGKVQKGDILITQMTFPAYLPAMQKAAAFVTDEGGLTCHAAIVAREMQKPCVIATKIATKVFKDGNLVEVDANKGIVRLLQ